jgi:hypothetical protein
MDQFSPINKPLWQVALATAQRQHAAEQDRWRVRQTAVEFYLHNQGEFATAKPQPMAREHRLALTNLLVRRGVVINASLMARSLNHQWRQYLGHDTVALATVQATSMPLIIRPQQYFGIRASAFGYELLLPDARNSRIMVPSHIGYTLMSLSRQLSIRETKYRDASTLNQMALTAGDQI